MVEERLLTVRGVVSFTFNMPRHRCVVRVRTDLKPEVCVHAHILLKYMYVVVDYYLPTVT